MLSEKISALVAVLMWVGIATYADTLFKRTGSLASWPFVIGCGLYASSAFLAFYVFRTQQWRWVMIFWNVVALGVGLLLSVTLFHEPLTPRRIIACVLLLGAIFVAE